MQLVALNVEGTFLLMGHKVTSRRDTGEPKFPCFAALALLLSQLMKTRQEP